MPITAGGIAFMYNIPGLTKTLQLSSYSACAILTGGISNWNDPASPRTTRVSLPNLAIRPVTESDSAGTNFVLEEWCIDEQPALWAAFANQENHQSGGPTDGVAINTNIARTRTGRGCRTAWTSRAPPAWPATSRPTPAPSAPFRCKYATDYGFGTG